MKIATLFISGLTFSIVAWVFSVLVIQQLLALQEDITKLDYTPETWQTWGKLKFLSRAYVGWALLGIIAILWAGAWVGQALTGPTAPGWVAGE